MTNPLHPQTYAEQLIEVTKEYTLRPKKEDRVNVCVSVLEYLLNNFSYELETGDEDFGQYVNVDDIRTLIQQLKELK
jgi:hypothetical protein